MPESRHLKKIEIYKRVLPVRKNLTVWKVIER